MSGFGDPHECLLDLLQAPHHGWMIPLIQMERLVVRSGNGAEGGVPVRQGWIGGGAGPSLTLPQVSRGRKTYLPHPRMYLQLPMIQMS